MEKVQGVFDENLVIKKAQLSEGMKIADLGCGYTGRFTFPMAKLVGRSGLVYAVDAKKEVLVSIAKLAKRENLSNIKTIWSNLEIFKATKIESSSVDVALLMNILFQSQKRAEIIREAVRLLKKDCRLVIVEWNKTAALFGPPVASRISKENLKNSLSKAGLKLEEEFEPGPYHYGLVCIKV